MEPSLPGAEPPSGDIRALAAAVTASKPGLYHLKLAASDSSGVAALKAIGVAVTVGLDGTWQQEVSLTGATTTMALMATDAAGKVTNNSLALTQ